MLSRNWLPLIAFALSFVPSLASADESLSEAVQRRIEAGLMKPLADFERDSSRFSRSRPPPRERRVRVTQAATSVDKDGREYLPFAIDVRFGGGEWRANDIVGCAYVKSGDLFVKRGEEFRPAAFLLGKNADPVAGVCVPVPHA